MWTCSVEWVFPHFRRLKLALSLKNALTITGPCLAHRANEAPSLACQPHFPYCTIAEQDYQAPRHLGSHLSSVCMFICVLVLVSNQECGVCLLSTEGIAPPSKVVQLVLSCLWIMRFLLCSLALVYIVVCMAMHVLTWLKIVQCIICQAAI